MSMYQELIRYVYFSYVIYRYYEIGFDRRSIVFVVWSNRIQVQQIKYIWIRLKVNYLPPLGECIDKSIEQGSMTN